MNYQTNWLNFIKHVVHEKYRAMEIPFNKSLGSSFQNYSIFTAKRCFCCYSRLFKVLERFIFSCDRKKSWCMYCQEVKAGKQKVWLRKCICKLSVNLHSYICLIVQKQRTLKCVFIYFDVIRESSISLCKLGLIRVENACLKSQ